MSNSDEYMYYFRVRGVFGGYAGHPVVEAHSDAYYEVGAIGVVVWPDVAVHSEHTLVERVAGGHGRQPEQR